MLEDSFDAARAAEAEVRFAKQDAVFFGLGICSDGLLTVVPVQVVFYGRNTFLM